jgi:O-acetyl-ADP-ribose deacetylase (regulator of RNase III)
MGQVQTIQGDIFKQNVSAIVNPVNCVGVMGAGLALAFKQRHPDMFTEYQRVCAAGQLRPGQIHTWEVVPGRWIVNLPTKDHWRDPSRREYVLAGLQALVAFARDQKLGSIAMPALGCGLGGLKLAEVEPLIAAAADQMPATRLSLILVGRQQEVAVGAKRVADRDLGR